MVEKALKLNLTVENSSRVYIKSINNNSLKLLSLFFSFGKKIEGFVDDNYSGLKLMNHVVISSKQCVLDQSSVLINSEENELFFSKTYKQMFVPNFECGNGRVILYGCGYVGRNMATYLKSMNIKVAFFLDKNVWNDEYEGIPILSSDNVNLIKPDDVVILCGSFWREMLEIIQSKGINGSFYYWELDTTDLVLDNNSRFTVMNTLHLSRFSTEKNYLYGNREQCEKYSTLLMFLNIRFEIIIQSDEPIVDLISLIDEKNYALFLTGNENKDLINILSDIGLEETKHYWSLRNFSNHFVLTRKCVVDINLGYTYLYNNVPGYKIIGNNLNNDYRILILGGSTTDGGYNSDKGWVDICFEKMNRNDITIYNGAIRGYSSTMEMIKLYRDVMAIKPNLVIAYNGINDLNHNTINDNHNPFSFNYLISLFSLFSNNSNNINKGMEYEVDGFCTWINNIQMMNYLCNINKIDFISIVQPMIASKVNHSFDEKSIALNYRCANEALYSEQNEFRKKVAEYVNCNSELKIFDLSAIFDEHNEDIYVDNCHVTQRGNYIIAEGVLNYLKKYI